MHSGLVKPTPDLSPLSGLRFLVVGLARNCEKTVRADIDRIKTALGASLSVHWFLIESDSSDRTVLELSKARDEVKDFQFETLGSLRLRFPKRTDRISVCRNSYVNEIRSNKSFENIDYVVVADFDGLNSHITRVAIESCWTRDGWDICAANQRGPYYDIWALRHAEWSPNDCWQHYGFLLKFNGNPEFSLRAAVHSRMITIPEKSDWIEVESAFGGFAIYRKKLFEYAEYSGLNEQGEESCEHVYFHRQLAARKIRFFINPDLINAKYTEHSRGLLFFSTLDRRFRVFLKRIIGSIFGGEFVGNINRWALFSAKKK
jgi:hypothetical protein